MTVITLYMSRREINLEKTIDVRNLNLPMNNTDFKIYKNSYFDIIFNIKNNDRKPINLLGKQLQISVINPYNGESEIIKKLTILDHTLGKAQLTLLPTETAKMTVGTYRYSVIVINEDNSQYLLLTDQNTITYGYFNLIDGALPVPNESMVVTSDDFYTFGKNFDPNTTYYLSKWIPGPIQKNIKDPLHTVAIYLENFSGKIWIQATNLDQPTQQDLDWYYINLSIDKPELVVYQQYGIVVENFETNSYWLRIQYLPDPMPDPGKIKQILVKN